MTNKFVLSDIDLENMSSIEYQELDRKRIADELHDTSLQDLTHLIHQIELSSLYIDVDPIKAKLELEDVNNQLRKVIKEIRNTIFHLRPMLFDDLGLHEAILQYIDNLQKKYSILVETDLDNIDYLNENVKLTIYRVIQECLVNAAKHADAQKINLKISNTETDILIMIEDDGIGIDNKINKCDGNNHYGLLIVKERISNLQGVFSISSGKGKGTIINISIPKVKGDVYEN